MSVQPQSKAEERNKSAEAVKQLAAQKEQRKKAEEERRLKAEEDRKVAEEKRARRVAEEKERKRKVPIPLPCRAVTLSYDETNRPWPGHSSPHAVLYKGGVVLHISSTCRVC